jgi:hypothetical protein
VLDDVKRVVCSSKPFPSLAFDACQFFSHCGLLVLLVLLLLRVVQGPQHKRRQSLGHRVLCLFGFFRFLFSGESSVFVGFSIIEIGEGSILVLDLGVQRGVDGPGGLGQDLLHGGLLDSLSREEEVHNFIIIQ